MRPAFEILHCGYAAWFVVLVCSVSVVDFAKCAMAGSPRLESKVPSHQQKKEIILLTKQRSIYFYVMRAYDCVDEERIDEVEKSK